jgi:hypothetical protein
MLSLPFATLWGKGDELAAYIASLRRMFDYWVV